MKLKIIPFFKVALLKLILFWGIDKIDWQNLRKQKAPLIPSPLDLNEILKSNSNEENRNKIFKEN